MNLLPDDCKKRIIFFSVAGEYKEKLSCSVEKQPCLLVSKFFREHALELWLDREFPSIKTRSGNEGFLEFLKNHNVRRYKDLEHLMGRFTSFCNAVDSHKLNRITCIYLRVPGSNSEAHQTSIIEFNGKVNPTNETADTDEIVFFTSGIEREFLGTPLEKKGTIHHVKYRVNSPFNVKSSVLDVDEMVTQTMHRILREEAPRPEPLSNQTSLTPKLLIAIGIIAALGMGYVYCRKG